MIGKNLENCPERGLGISSSNLSISIGSGFFPLFFFGFPVFYGEYMENMVGLIINNNCNYRGDLWNFPLF